MCERQHALRGHAIWLMGCGWRQYPRKPSRKPGKPFVFPPVANYVALSSVGWVLGL